MIEMGWRRIIRWGYDEAYPGNSATMFYRLVSEFHHFLKAQGLLASMRNHHNLLLMDKILLTYLESPWTTTNHTPVANASDDFMAGQPTHP